MDRRVTPSDQVTSPTWDSPPPCKQALSRQYNNFARASHFFVHSSPFMHDYDEELPKFTFY